MNTIKENLLAVAPWLRLIFLLLYTIVLYLLFFPVLLLLVILQFLCVLFTGVPNSNLRRASGVFAAYISQIIDYLTYNSNTKPWPFNAVARKNTIEVERADVTIEE